MFAFGALYVRVMYDGVVSSESLVEAANFATQTATTIGYGNWIPAAMKADDPRIPVMKAASVPFMLASAALFSAIVGVAANWISRLD